MLNELPLKRRHAQYLLASCEEGGHLFLVIFQQHKGATQVSTEPVPDAVADVLLNRTPSRTGALDLPDPWS